MESKKVFQRYYSRLAREGIVKSLILGLIAGFAASLIFSLVAIFTNSFATIYNYDSTAIRICLIALGIIVVVTLIALPIFYRLFFMPTIKQIVRRIDNLGLEERMVTMLELENDESFMAMRQRQDAKENLKKVNHRQLKIMAFMLIPTIIVGVLAIASTTMIAVASHAKPPVSWQPIAERGTTEPEGEKEYIRKYWTIEYITTGGGYIAGDKYQVVEEGEDGEKVFATPYPGFVFVDWITTGSENPLHQFLEVYEHSFDTARFQPGDNDGDEENDTQDTQERPDDGGDGEEEFDPDLIIDGTIYFREERIFDEYFSKAMAILAAGGEIPQDLKILLEIYFDALR